MYRGGEGKENLNVIDQIIAIHIGASPKLKLRSRLRIPTFLRFPLSTKCVPRTPTNLTTMRSYPNKPPKKLISAIATLVCIPLNLYLRSFPLAGVGSYIR